jgi:glycerophosphoryl diester phosphodiesterase
MCQLGFLCAIHVRSPFHSITDIVLVAHRGCEWPFPENSLAAVVHGAKFLGFVEIDLALTRDGDVVLMHDSTVDRTTNGSGIVCELSSAEVENLRLVLPSQSSHIESTGHLESRTGNLSSARSKSFSHFVPSLEAVFGALPVDTKYMLDVKVCYVPGTKFVSESDVVRCNVCSRMISQVHQLMTKFDIAVERTIFTSTDVHSLRAFAAYFPSASFSLSVDLKFVHLSVTDFMALLEADDWDAVCMYFGTASLRPDLVRAVKSSRSRRSGSLREVYAWTMRNQHHVRLALCSGVTNLIVADPWRMSKHITEARSERLAVGE